MDDNKSVKDYFRLKASEEIVKKYLFLKTLEENYDNEYIKINYRINPLTIQMMYDSLNEDERKAIEAILKKQIEENEIDLKEEAKKWHRNASKNINKNGAYRKEKGER